MGYAGVFVRCANTNIIPFVVGNIDFAKRVYDIFAANSMYPSPHFYPASPRNKSVVRFTICNTVSYEQIDKVLGLLRENLDDFKPWEWPDTKDDVFNMGFIRDAGLMNG